MPHALNAQAHGKSRRSAGRPEALVDIGDEREAHEIAAGVRAVRRAREERARQNRHIIVGIEALGELGVRQARARHVGPQVKGRVRQAHVEYLGEHGRDGGELLHILRSVLAHMGLVVPGGDARGLKDGRQRSAVVCAV